MPFRNKAEFIFKVKKAVLQKILQNKEKIVSQAKKTFKEAYTQVAGLVPKASGETSYAVDTGLARGSSFVDLKKINENTLRLRFDIATTATREGVFYPAQFVYGRGVHAKFGARNIPRAGATFFASQLAQVLQR